MEQPQKQITNNVHNLQHMSANRHKHTHEASPLHNYYIIILAQLSYTEHTHVYQLCSICVVCVWTCMTGCMGWMEVHMHACQQH